MHWNFKSMTLGKYFQIINLHYIKLCVTNVPKTQQHITKPTCLMVLLFTLQTFLKHTNILLNQHVHWYY